MNFACTLGISHPSLQAVLAEFDDDAWHVKKLSCWLSMRRQVMLLALRAKKDNMWNATITETLGRLNDSAAAPAFAGSHVELGDELRTVLELIRKDNAATVDQINSAHHRLDCLEQHECLISAGAINTHLQKLDSRLLSIESRIDRLSNSMAEAIRLVQESRRTKR